MESLIPVALEQVVLGVENVDEAREQFEKILGLETLEVTSDKALLAVPSRNFLPLNPISLVQDKHVGLLRLKFAVLKAHDLEKAYNETKDFGLVAELNNDELVVKDPDGIEVVFAAGGKRVRQLPKRLDLGISRLGHVTRSSKDPLTACSFYTKTGFELTEQLGDSFYWLRAGHLHHVLGIEKGPRVQIRHIAFQLRDWTCLKSAVEHISNSGLKVEFGPGRHVIGDNIFVYFHLPIGLRIELFCEMCEIEPGGEFDPIVQDPSFRSTSINYWGPKPPDSFISPDALELWGFGR